MTDINPHIQHCAKRILECQQSDGRIFWIDGGIFDPWNHTLSAMALQTAGYRSQADAAFAVLHTIQQADGALPGQCGASAPLDANNQRLLAAEATSLIDTNFSAFPVLGMFHAYCVHGDKTWLAAQFELVQSCLTFVLEQQSAHGEIAWRRREKDEKLEQVDALRTGNYSIYKSLNAAILIGEILGKPTKHWQQAAGRVHHALSHLPFRFDRTWDAKSRFAMDWYYPVLSGAVDGNAARTLLDARYDEFVDVGLGCRCVADEPWTTTAETCELIMALLAVGDKKRAASLMAALSPLRCDEGGYWMGWQSQQNIYWPLERPSWTAAAVILALDALHQITPAANVLVGRLQPLQHHQ